MIVVAAAAVSDGERDVLVAAYGLTWGTRNYLKCATFYKHKEHGSSWAQCVEDVERGVCDNSSLRI